MTHQPHRILLIDVDREGCEVLAARLRAHGYLVDTAHDGASGAEMALSQPPSTVIADLWMPGISGVQLCRLLRAEAATADVPIILRAEQDDPRSRFWAERAGAVALVPAGRMGELARALKRIASTASPEGGFFTHLGVGPNHIRDRIAEHLDTALFESVIAAEIRALATASSFEWLFDCVSQLTSQLMTYHWLAISTESSCRMGVHGHPASVETSEAQARLALEVPLDARVHRVADKDAREHTESLEIPVLVRDIRFGNTKIGSVAVAVTASSFETEALVELIARELGGAITIATLFEESRRLAATDSMTGLLNRRAFIEAANCEVQRCERTESDVVAMLLDVDHFKLINDRRGHATGDSVLTALGTLLLEQLRAYDSVARWGGEEFVVLLPNANHETAPAIAERLRVAIASAIVSGFDGQPVTFTASIGVAVRRPGEGIDAMVDRADAAMYAAKAGGRNRVALAPEEGRSDMPSSAHESTEARTVLGVSALGASETH